MRTFNLLVAAFALLQVVRYARGALLFLLPAVRVRAEADVEPSSPARLRAADELEALGFVPLGALTESGPLGAFSREAEVYGSGRGVFADVVEQRPGEVPALELVTAFPDGAFVVTSSGRRRPLATPAAQVGAMPGAAAAGLLGAHEKAVARFVAAHGAATEASDLATRLAVAQRWYAGVGRSELRRAHVVAFAVLLVALALFASSAHILLRSPTPR